MRPSLHFCFLAPSGRDQEFSCTGWPGSEQSKANNASIHLYAVHVHVHTWPGTWCQILSICSPPVQDLCHALPSRANGRGRRRCNPPKVLPLIASHPPATRSSLSLLASVADGRAPSLPPGPSLFIAICGTLIGAGRACVGCCAAGVQQQLANSVRFCVCLIWGVSGSDVMCRAEGPACQLEMPDLWSERSRAW